MKRNFLIKRLKAIAKVKGTQLERVGGRGPHDKFRLNSTALIIPRHTEINELTARSIIKAAEGA